MQRLLAGDVVMVVNFNARVTGAAKENKRNLVVAWTAGFWVGTDYWVQIANGPNPSAAAKMLEFYSRPATQAELVKNLRLRRADPGRLRPDAGGDQERPADLARQGGVGGGL